MKYFFIPFVMLLTACNNNEPSLSKVNTQIQTQCSTTQTVTVRGTSMLGIFNNNDELTLQQKYYNCHPVQFKDIIVFEYNQQRNFIKQVYGMPGDILTYKDNYLLINNKKIKNHTGEFYQVDKVGKSYVDLMQQTIMKNSIIPRGYFWVLGTTKISGYDSRRIGLVPLQHISGKIQTDDNRR